MPVNDCGAQAAGLCAPPTGSLSLRLGLVVTVLPRWGRPGAAPRQHRPTLA